MTDVRRLKTIAAYMVSDPEMWSDGQVVASAAYELLRLRHFMSQVPDDMKRNFTYISGLQERYEIEKEDKQDADRGG